MNERIQELAIQANDHTGNEFDLNHKQLDTFLKKFAELIVQDCVKVAKDPRWYSESPSEGWRNPIRYVCKVMKEHFGVEQ